jgi:hypothetical protein
MPDRQRPAPGLERPAFTVLQIAFVARPSVACPCGQTVDTLTAVREHWDAGHFDRRPLNTSSLPPARRILGRGAGPKPPR